MQFSSTSVKLQSDAHADITKLNGKFSKLLSAINYYTFKKSPVKAARNLSLMLNFPFMNHTLILNTFQ